MLSFGRCDPVRPNGLKDSSGVGCAETPVGGMQLLKEVGKRNDGEIRYFRASLLRRALGRASRRLRDA